MTHTTTYQPTDMVEVAGHRGWFVILKVDGDTVRACRGPHGKVYEFPTEALTLIERF